MFCLPKTAWPPTSSGTVTKWDCIVCHMEGSPTTGEFLPSPAGKHGDGYVDLRDPDTGLQIKGVTFTAASGASPGSYAPTTADLTGVDVVGSLWREPGWNGI